MRNYEEEIKARVAFIQKKMEQAHADGLVFGNSGGKDSALVGILCSMATKNLLAVAMPCNSKRNYGEDLDDATALAKNFGIDMITVDLTETRSSIISAMKTELSDGAKANIAPRLRMTTLYAIAQTRNSLVVGTGNRSESYMGYFTKWGDGAYDINPIADLTVTEIYEFLEYLGAPRCVIDKAPSAALFEGQTDEDEMGVTYAAIDRFLFTGEASDKDRKIIDRYHNASEHKRRMPLTYPGDSGNE